MQDDRPTTIDPGKFVAWRTACWLPACLGIGAAAAWTAHVAQSYFAPLILFPLLVGVGIGAMLVALMRLGNVAHRTTVVAGTVLAVAAAVAGQHYFLYQAARQRARHDLQVYEKALRVLPGKVQGRVPEPPASFAQFLQAEAAHGRVLPWGYIARGWAAWTTWTIDAMLVLAATLAIVVSGLRQPFCNRCQSWYHTVRSGRIDARTAWRLAEATGISLPGEFGSARYRLLHCDSGCGPTAFELSWERLEGGHFVARAWLDADGRRRVSDALEGSLCHD